MLGVMMSMKGGEIGAMLDIPTMTGGPITERRGGAGVIHGRMSLKLFNRSLIA